MEQLQTNEKEKRSSGWLLAIAIIIISILIYWVINEFAVQENPQVKDRRMMQIMV